MIIWDLDGFVGALNATMPYNYHFDYHERELDCVVESLNFLNEYNIKTTYAITGFSAEKGIYPYTFPSLINDISLSGHEVASHSWRHEWLPFFSEAQVLKSLERSKSALEEVIGKDKHVIGFVPPHNRPATWIRKGAFNPSDLGVFPLFKMGDVSNVINGLKATDYKWIRTTYNPIWNFFKKKTPIRPQSVFSHKGIMVLQNHYNGFDNRIIDYIKHTEKEYFMVSAHPIMLSYEKERSESWFYFRKFISTLIKDPNIVFICPSDIVSTFGIE